MHTADRREASPVRTLGLALAATPGLLLSGALFFFVAALFASAFPDAPGREVASLLSTLVMAAPALVGLALYLGAARGVLAFACVGLFGYGIETLGVVSGFPYGGFSYSDALGMKLFGLVPYLLPVSYVPLVIGAVAAGVSVFRTFGLGASRLRVALLSAALLVLVDALLDPGAVALGFWSWEADGLYYGIPLSNYFGWLLSGFIASYLLLLFGDWSRRPQPLTLDGLILASAFWVGVAVFHLLLLPAVLGAALFCALLLTRARLVRRAPEPGVKIGRP